MRGKKEEVPAPGRNWGGGKSEGVSGRGPVGFGVMASHPPWGGDIIKH